MRVAIVLAAVGALACTERKAEPGGVGPFRFSATTLAKVSSGRCQPHTFKDGRNGTWCFGVTPFKIGTRPAEVDLYFDGTEPTARLIEIQLKIRGCNETDVEQWMRVHYGAPVETKGPAAYYQNSFLWAAAFMPESPGRCMIQLLPLSEAAEIARIKSK